MRHRVSFALAASCVGICLAALLTAAPAAAKDPGLDPALAYQAERSNEVTYDIDFAVAVSASYQTKVLKVWLPLPQSDSAQEVTEGEITVFPTKVEPQIGSESLFGNTFAYFEFENP